MWRFCLVFLLILSGTANAHPEDEFCIPGEGGMDPALCAALAELDRADSAGKNSQLAFVLGNDGENRSQMETATLYLQIGVNHILPGGLDHILFVLALVLVTIRWRPLVLQISAFTLAHTITLALASAGVISPPAQIVEPLIAATIAYVAFENMVVRKNSRWRALIVFGFGLLHGLGFAGFFAELGLPTTQFWSALLGFNVGVEVGQLVVVALAASLLFIFRLRIGDANGTGQYRRYVVLPGSALIGLTGLWWAVSRSFF